MRVDVAVVGGGSAGIAAAVSAARSGARVILIERQGTLGGQVVGALVHSMCGLYCLRDTDSQPLVPAYPGFPMEFANRLLANGGARGPVRMGRLDVLLHKPEAFSSLAESLCAEAHGLEVRLYTEVSEAKPGGHGGSMVLLLDSRGRREHLEADAVVDASGDGELAVMVGAAWMQAPADRLQRPGFIFKLSGLDASALSGDGRIRIAQALSAAVTDGILPASAFGVAFRSGVADDEAWGTIDLASVSGSGILPMQDLSSKGRVPMPRFLENTPVLGGTPVPHLSGSEPWDSTSLSLMESDGRDTAKRIFRFLHEHVAGFQRCELAVLPARAGIRESRRISGQYELSTDDVINGATFADQVAWATWPMELRERATGPKFRFPIGGQPCGIPLRALRFQHAEGLFMAGRCISCSHEAQASIRVIGTCLASGEAAGKAAAIHASKS